MFLSGNSEIDFFLITAPTDIRHLCYFVHVNLCSEGSDTGPSRSFYFPSHLTWYVI